MRSIAIREVLTQAALTDPNRSFLRLDLDRAVLVVTDQPRHQSEPPSSLVAGLSGSAALGAGSIADG